MLTLFTDFMKYLKGFLLWFCLFIFLYILVLIFLNATSILPDPDFLNTFTKRKYELNFGTAFFGAILICPLFYKSFRQKFRNQKFRNVFWIICCLIFFIFLCWDSTYPLQIKPTLIRENFVSFDKKCDSENKRNRGCKYEFSTQSKSKLKFFTSIRNSREIETGESQFIQSQKSGDCISFYIWADDKISDFKKC